MKVTGNKSKYAGRIVLACALCCACVALTVIACLGGPAKSPVSQTSGAGNAIRVSDAQTQAAPDSASASAPAPTSANPYIGMHEDEYEPSVVLVCVDGEQAAREASATLAQLDYVEDATPDSTDVNAGFIKARLAQDANVIDAISDISGMGLHAEPNIYLYPLEIEDPPEADHEPARDDSGPVVDPQAKDSTPNTVQEDTEGKNPSLTLLGAEIPTTTAGAPAISAQAAEHMRTTIDDYNGQPGSYQWGLDSIRAFDAWSVQKGEGAPVSVAIIDTGCVLDHDDFMEGRNQSNILTSYNACDPSEDAYDENGHGTHVAGIISARANNGKGIAGATYNAKIIPIKTSDATGNFTSEDVITALQWTIDNKDTYNIKVVNMSLGSNRTSSSLCDTYNTSYENNALVQKMKKACDAGILITCASGNYANKGSDRVAITPVSAYYSYPSDYVPDSIGAIALGTDGVSRAPFSNYNVAGQTTKSLSAPGVDIYSTSNTGAMPYMTRQGTSMASPYVASAAALVFAALPDASPKLVREILYASAKDIGDDGFDLETGYGEVDAYHALQLATARVSPQAMGYGETRPLVMEAPEDVTVDGVATRQGVELDAADQTCWTFSSSDDSIATVDSATRTISARKAGTVTITATHKGIPGLASTTTVTVEPLDISPANIAPIVAMTYDGTAKTPLLDVRLDGKSLIKDTDYTVTYDDNVNAGTACATVTGIGNYAGTKQARFTIERASISKATLMSKASVTYDGSAQAFPGTLSYAGKTLSEGAGKDYTVTYRNNVNAGTGSATIRGTGNFEGSRWETFAILPADISLVSVTPIPAQTYTGSAITPTCTLKHAGKKLAAGLGKDYSITYANNVAIGTASISITGAGNYTGTRKLGFAIEPISLVDPANAVKVSTTGMMRNVTGKALAATVSVKAGEKTLTAGTDYAVLYNGSAKKPRKAGTYKVTVKGKGIYGGTLSAGTMKIWKGPSSNAKKKLTIRTSAKGALRIGFSGTKPKAKANVITNTSTGASNQTFHLTRGKDGYYTISCSANKKLVLEAAGLSPKKGANVRIATKRNTANQKWVLQKSGKAWVIRNAANPKQVLDVAGSKPKRGANVTVRPYVGTSNQKWVIR